MDESKTPPTKFGIVPLSNFVPRGFGFVHHSIAILYHQVSNLSITIRNFCIAVPHRTPRGCQCRCEGRQAASSLCVDTARATLSGACGRESETIYVPEGATWGRWTQRGCPSNSAPPHTHPLLAASEKEKKSKERETPARLRSPRRPYQLSQL
jgi:hypothetical protein